VLTVFKNIHILKRNPEPCSSTSYPLVDQLSFHYNTPLFQYLKVLSLLCLLHHFISSGSVTERTVGARCDTSPTSHPFGPRSTSRVNSLSALHPRTGINSCTLTFLSYTSSNCYLTGLQEQHVSSVVRRSRINPSISAVTTAGATLSLSLVCDLFSMKMTH
jgi:hypothetical protein